MIVWILSSIFIYLIGFLIYYRTHYYYLSLWYWVADNGRSNSRDSFCDVSMFKTSRAYQIASGLFSWHDNDDWFQSSWSLFWQSFFWPVLLPAWAIWTGAQHCRFRFAPKHLMIDRYRELIERIGSDEVLSLAEALRDNDRVEKRLIRSGTEYQEEAVQIILKRELDL